MNNLKLIYSQIVQGYSVTPSGLFIKHFGIKDEAILQSLYLKFFNIAVHNKHLKPEKEWLIEMQELGLWTKEPEILSLKEKIGNYETSVKLLKNLQDIIFIENEMEKAKKTLSELELEKQNKMDVTAESYAFSKMNEYAIEHGFYKDCNFSERAFKDLGNTVDSEEFNRLIEEYNSTIKEITPANIKKIAFSNILLNHIYLADSSFQFYGKAVTDLSYFQIDLFSYGLQYKNIVASQGYPPAHIIEPDDIIEWSKQANQPEQTSKQMPKKVIDQLKTKGSVNFRELVQANHPDKRIIF